MWLLVFFLIPIVEMYLLIEVGGYIGALPTIALVMLTAVIGVGLLRLQGLSTLTRGLNRLEGGEVPAREVAEGLLLAIAGALLLTPGFVTDAIGFALLTPAVRRRVAQRMLARVEIRAAGTPFGAPGSGGPGTGRPGPGDAGPGRVLEGEFERVDGSRADEPDNPDAHR